MKRSKLAIANALTLATVIIWTACTVIVAVLPGFSLTVTEWWMHGLDISVMGSYRPTLNSFILGGITWAGAAWVSGYVFGWAWEITSKK